MPDQQLDLQLKNYHLKNAGTKASTIKFEAIMVQTPHLALECTALRISNCKLNELV
jgi:hypothetical protein